MTDKETTWAAAALVIALVKGPDFILFCVKVHAYFQKVLQNHLEIYNEVKKDKE